LLNLEPGVEDIRRIGAEAVIPAVLTRAVLLKAWSLPINLKTANAMGLMVPSTLLATAALRKPSRKRSRCDR
jgi:hypothetical protein